MNSRGLIPVGELLAHHGAEFFAAAFASVIIVLYTPLWARARHVVTFVHEGGHAVAAVLTGRRLSGIKLHRDTSGSTMTSGRRSGLGLAMTAVAGYLAPALGGVLMLVLAHEGWTRQTLIGAFAVCTGSLAYVRNIFGFAVVFASMAALGALIWYASTERQLYGLIMLASLLTAGAARDSIELWAARRRGSRSSDADILARCTYIPAVIWVVFFIVMTGTSLVLLTWLLTAL